jgi:hypothetical protein
LPLFAGSRRCLNQVLKNFFGMSHLTVPTVQQPFDSVEGAGGVFQGRSCLGTGA